MLTNSRWLGVVLVISLAFGGIPAHAQSGDAPSAERRYYPQFGHWLEGEFLDTYLSVSNATEIFGYPITQAFHHPIIGRRVQYFERGRFELLPENPPELRVKFSDLGTLYYESGGQELPLPPNFPACQPFRETGKQVCYAFLEYFIKNGGVATFGYPITNFETQDGLIVQYFQRARFEWHPELPHQERVTLTDLGRRYFYKIHEDPDLLLPERRETPDASAPMPIIDLHVRAFPLFAVAPQTGSQSIYVIVQDQNLLPVPDAQIRLVIKLPSGDQRVIVPELSNGFGIVHYSFNYKDEPIDVVPIIVSATYDSYQSQSVTSFRVWY